MPTMMMNDPARLELVGLAESPIPDEARERLRAAYDRRGSVAAA